MFYDLRGQTSVLRHTYIVLSQSDPEECRYCEGHGLVPVTNTNPSDFLERLASELKRVGTDVPAEIGWERSREETDDDFESKAWIAAREYARKSLTGGGVAESSSQLEASVVFGSFLRRALSEKGGRQTPETLLLKAREQWSEETGMVPVSRSRRPSLAWAGRPRAIRATTFLAGRVKTSIIC